MAGGERGPRVDQASRDGDVAPSGQTIPAPWAATDGSDRATESAMEHRFQGALPHGRPALLLPADGSGLVQPLHHRMPSPANELVRAELAGVREAISEVRVA